MQPRLIRLRPAKRRRFRCRWQIALVRDHPARIVRFIKGLVIKWFAIGPWRSLASALAWGARGPGFKSRRPDQPNQSDRDRATMSLQPSVGGSSPCPSLMGGFQSIFGPLSHLVRFESVTVKLIAPEASHQGGNIRYADSSVHRNPTLSADVPRQLLKVI